MTFYCSGTTTTFPDLLMTFIGSNWREPVEAGDTLTIPLPYRWAVPFFSIPEEVIHSRVCIQYHPTIDLIDVTDRPYILLIPIVTITDDRRLAAGRIYSVFRHSIPMISIFRYSLPPLLVVFIRHLFGIPISKPTWILLAWRVQAGDRVTRAQFSTLEWLFYSISYSYILRRYRTVKRVVFLVTSGEGGDDDHSKWRMTLTHSSWNYVPFGDMMEGLLLLMALTF